MKTQNKISSGNTHTRVRCFERLAEWFQVLKKSRISLLSFLIVTSAFFLAPQAEDVLRSLAEPNTTCQLILFESFLLIWGIVVWYGARFILDQNFEAMRDIAAPDKHTRVLWGESFLPRFFGSAGIGGVGLAMVLAVRQVLVSDGMHYQLIYWLGIVNMALGFFFHALFKFRIPALKKISGFLRYKAPGSWLGRKAQYQGRKVKARSFRQLSGFVRKMIVTCLAASLAAWFFLFFNLQTAAPKMGAAAILFLGFVFITIFGTGLVWLGERTRLPMILLLMTFAGIVGTWNDNHAVRKEKEVFSPSGQLTAAGLYKSWLTKMDTEYGTSRPHPLFIVASSGGGIKAAYWTATVLGSLQDRNDSFAKHTIIISPVSGGALGSLTFARLVANGRKEGRSYEEMSKLLLSQDFLSPALGSLLFHDLPARFSPFPNLVPDRAKALEAAWERAWTSEAYVQYKNPDPGEIGFDIGFSSLFESELGHLIPTLLINGTSVEKGERIITSHLDIADDFPDCDSFFKIRPNDIRISTAAMMSARFTYISPAGTITKNDHVVDGGYYENSGSETALEFFENIEEDLLRDVRKNRVRPIFVQIDNDYWTEAAPSLRIFPELITPIAALLKAREARADSAAVRAQIVFDHGEISNGLYFHYNFCAPQDVKAPLGWYLSHAAQMELQRQLHGEVVCNANVTDNTNRQNSDAIYRILEPFNSKPDRPVNR